MNKSLLQTLKEANLKSVLVKKEKIMPTAVPDGSIEEEKYPYELRLRLNPDVMDQLNLSSDDFKASSDIMILAKCNVISVSSNETTKGRKDNVELQITKINIQEN